jgi:hypothetical protein
MIVEFTNELLEKGKSRNGGWSRKQLKLIGIKYPLKKGWKRKVIGKLFDASTIEQFLALKDFHLLKKEIAEDKVNDANYADFLHKTEGI